MRDMQSDDRNISAGYIIIWSVEVMNDIILNKLVSTYE